jgi:hypothetical protein
VELARLVFEEGVVRAASKRDDPKPLRLSAYHVKRLTPDRPRRAKDRDAVYRIGHVTEV